MRLRLLLLIFSVLLPQALGQSLLGLRMSLLNVLGEEVVVEGVEAVHLVLIDMGEEEVAVVLMQ